MVYERNSREGYRADRDSDYGTDTGDGRDYTYTILLGFCNGTPIDHGHIAGHRLEPIRTRLPRVYEYLLCIQ